MDDMEAVEILILAGLAGFILFRLWSVLGRRTGSERPPSPGPSRGFGQKPQPQPQPLPGAPELADTGQSVPVPGHGDGVRRPLVDVPAGSPLAATLTRIALADRNFEPQTFLHGARAAHELIVVAFARGDRAALRPLLSSDVFDAFDGVIRAREGNGHKGETTIVAQKEAKLVDAELQGSMAEVTVRFVTEMITCVRDGAGVITEGSGEAVRQVTDVWSFARDTGHAGPNWKLVATESAT